MNIEKSVKYSIINELNVQLKIIKEKNHEAIFIAFCSE